MMHRIRHCFIALSLISHVDFIQAQTNAAYIRGTVDSSLISIRRPATIDIAIKGKTITTAIHPSLENCLWEFQAGPFIADEAILTLTDNPALSQQIKLKNGVNTTRFAARKIVHVGKTRAIKTPSQARKLASAGTLILIDPGTYADDSTVWRANGITLRGTRNATYITATKNIDYVEGDDAKNGKSPWVIAANDIRIEDVDIAGARVADGNGAALRIEGSNIDICGAHLHDNENGVLGTANNLSVRHSEIDNNGISENGQTHNIYIVGGSNFVLSYSYVHHAHIGHNVKSRAMDTRILYNYIADGANGTTSYSIEMPDGGSALLLGNIVQQGPQTDNSTIISFGAESLRPNSALTLIHNTIVNDLGTGDFVHQVGGNFVAQNNLLIGDGNWPAKMSRNSGNIRAAGDAVVAQDQADYRLRANGKARNAGVITPMRAEYEYRQPLRAVIRRDVGKPDVGALALQP